MAMRKVMMTADGSGRARGLGAAALAALALAALPLAAAAQSDALCADPRGFCGAAVAPSCRAPVTDGALENEADPACGSALKAYRVCLQDAADCPGLVDPITPASPAETRPPCADRGCAGAAPSDKAALAAAAPRRSGD